ncbi:MAG: hypothetical protein Q8N63_07110 [Nanoarchaeota archaeon]|nr:hypothetical protein [Nanoarchaeota archaeon]
MKKGCVISFLLLVLISNVIAYESTITVKTGLPNQEIIFKAGDQITGKILDGGEFRQKSDSEGKVVFDYNLEPILIKMSFMAWGGSGYSSFLNGKPAVFLNNVILDEFVDVDLNKKEPSFNAYSNESKEVAEGKITAEVEITEEANATSNLTTPTNLTIETQTEGASKTQKNTSTTGLTGAVISRGKGIFSSAKTYLILGGILVLVGGFIFIKKRGFGVSKANKFIVTKMSEMRANKEERNDELKAAERKLKEVQEELENLKNKKSKIKEVQERLRKDREELRRLGGTE